MFQMAALEGGSIPGKRIGKRREGMAAVRMNDSNP